MKKRILPALLALCMVVSLLPVAVFAANAVCPGKGQEGCICTACADKDADTHGDPANCATCKACAVCNPCTENDCKYKGEHAATTPHTWLCVCTDGTAQACNNDGHTAAERCTNTVSAKGEKCDACAGRIVCDDPDCKTQKTDGKHVGPHTYACACVTHGTGGKYQKCTNNTATEKGGLCPSCNTNAHRTTPPVCSNATEADACKAIGVPGLVHNLGCIEACTEEADCPATGAHKTNCVKAKLDAGTMDSATEEGVEFEFDCECTANHKDGGHIADAEDPQNNVACGEKVIVKADVFYTWEVTAAAEGATDEEKAAAEEATAQAKSDAFDAAKDAKQAELDDATYLCDACKAIELNACNGTVNCPAQAHNADCLSQCTMDANCKNTVGSATAHRVKYVVYADGAETQNSFDTRAAAIEYVNGQVATLRAPYIAARDAYDDAVEAYRAKIAAGQDASSEKTALDAAKVALDNAAAALDAAWVDYSVRSIHCPKAGVPNGVVITVDPEDGTVNTPDDNTTDTPKAPEKAADFDDLKGDEWYAEELTAALEKGFFKGSLDAGKYSFKATDKMNTSTLVVLVSRVLDKGFKTEGADWDKEAVEWAAKDGLTEGVEAGEVTRKDVVLVLWRAAGKPASEQDVSAFTDLADLEGDELTAMKWAVEKEIIKGDAGETKTARPADSITRAEMVAVVNRFDGVVNKK